MSKEIVCLIILGCLCLALFAMNLLWLFLSATFGIELNVVKAFRIWRERFARKKSARTLMPGKIVVYRGREVVCELENSKENMSRVVAMMSRGEVSRIVIRRNKND